MKHTTITIAFLAITVLGLGSASAADSPTTKATTIGGRLARGEFGGRQMSTSAPLNVVTGLASMPLAFTENQGQWDDQILFRANAGGATMWFTLDGAYYQFTRRIRRTGEANSPEVVQNEVEGRQNLLAGDGSTPLTMTAPRLKRLPLTLCWQEWANDHNACNSSFCLTKSSY